MGFFILLIDIYMNNMKNSKKLKQIIKECIKEIVTEMLGNVPNMEVVEFTNSGSYDTITTKGKIKINVQAGRLFGANVIDIDNNNYKLVGSDNSYVIVPKKSVKILSDDEAMKKFKSRYSI